MNYGSAHSPEHKFVVTASAVSSEVAGDDWKNGGWTAVRQGPRSSTPRREPIGIETPPERGGKAVPRALASEIVPGVGRGRGRRGHDTFPCLFKCWPPNRRRPAPGRNQAGCSSVNTDNRLRSQAKKNVEGAQDELGRKRRKGPFTRPSPSLRWPSAALASVAMPPHRGWSLRALQDGVQRPNAFSTAFHRSSMPLAKSNGSNPKSRYVLIAGRRSSSVLR